MISVVCPVVNESEYLEQLFGFLIKSRAYWDEIFFIDGGSIDDTKEKIKRFAGQTDGVSLLDNLERYVPFALNQAIPKCSQEIIVRLDAHCSYNDDYFLKILETFDRTGADIVGGPTRTAFFDAWQESIGFAISTPFGVGNSKVHQLDYEGPTDSVTFGAWKREVFAKVGLFDVELRRNQDDEFHYRAKSKGLTIYQSPEIKLYYYPRSNLSSLFKQYYEYGKYKPLVLHKVKSEIKMRHLIPSLFVIYLIAGMFLMTTFPLVAVPAVLYIAGLISFSFHNSLPFSNKLRLLIIYPVIHSAYGIGVLRGVIFPRLKGKY